MSKTITPWTDLDLLYKVMEMEESLLDIIGKPSKVSLAEKPNKQPLAYICGYAVPKRRPLSQRKYTGSPSALSLPLTGQSASAQGRRGSRQSDNNKSRATVQNPIFKHHTILTATKPTSNTSESLSSSPISANPKPTISSPSAKSSYSLSQSTQKRGRGIQAKTSHSIDKGGRAVKIQRLWRSLKQQIRVRISHRIQQSRLLHQISKHTKQVKAKQLQSNRGCNHRPPPILFETSIGSNDSNHNFLQHSFCTSRRARANIRLLVAALVVGILPMLHLIRTVKGFHGVHLTLLTSQSIIPTFRSTISQQATYVDRKRRIYARPHGS